MASYYEDNKNAQLLNEIRRKRMHEQEEKRRKDRIQVDINSKKTMLSSTNSMINAKTSALRAKEHSLNNMEAEVKELKRAIDQLSSDKVKMEMEIRRLETDLR